MPIRAWRVLPTYLRTDVTRFHRLFGGRWRWRESVRRQPLAVQRGAGIRTHCYANDSEHCVTLSTIHPAASRNHPVAVTADGRAIHSVSWHWHRIIEATDEELRAFEAAGYPAR